MSRIETETHRVCPFCNAVLEIRALTPLESIQLKAADELAKAAKAMKDCPYCGLGGKVEHDPTGCPLAAYERLRDPERSEKKARDLTNNLPTGKTGEGK